ncbi:hypothetical protein D3C71_1692890 [compost metagenome]
MVGRNAGGRGLGQQLVQHFARVARAGSDLQTLFAQPLQRLHRAVDGCGEFADLGNLHGHETRVDGIDIGIDGCGAKAGVPLGGNRFHLQQLVDMVPLGQPHGTARLGQREVDAKRRESLDKDLRGRKRAEVHQRAGPVEDDGLQRCEAGGGRRGDGVHVGFLGKEVKADGGITPSFG